MIFPLITTNELIERLSQHRQNNFAVDVVYACDVAPDLHMAFYEFSPHEQYFPLFKDTVYADLVEQMPYLRRVTAASEFESFVLNNTAPWGFFALTQAEFPLHAKHWQSLCEVVMPNGNKSFFSFQDPTPLASMVSQFTEQELEWYMGPATSLFIPTDQNGNDQRWLTVENPVCSNGDIEQLTHYTPSPYPWWEVQPAHLTGLQEQRYAMLAIALASMMWDKQPHTASLLESHYGGLDVNIQELIQQARSYGLQDEVYIEYFVFRLASVPPQSRQTEPIGHAMKTADLNPVDALAKLTYLLTGQNLLADQTSSQSNLSLTPNNMLM